MLYSKNKTILLLLIATFFMISVNAQKLNKLDANGKRTGVWKKLYPNGKTRYTGTFQNGKEIGVFKFYDINSSSQPSITKTFVNGTATVKFYNKLGKVKTQGKMIGKNRIGKWNYYFLNGKPFSQENYTNGKLDGELINYYPNGKITQQISYKNGLKNGVSKTFTDAGILIEEVLYLNDKLEGKAKYYDLKGNIKEEGVYQKGKRVGKWEFYMDGEKVDKKKTRKLTDLKN
ncbi:toxin-antitoxin system YwqK family antitoxin [Tenacibaculum piscium]|uniref:toxin-antitoxin system YwqK family antitoxin n=1 Tax=Tenacibaculum piscium TaxID=1458515 RepID=UPI001F332CBB|nr:toxin-antitoxin system YwqK family antitoxin [Tenacibaculum piscium]